MSWFDRLCFEIQMDAMFEDSSDLHDKMEEVELGLFVVIADS
jgi:hypothetical protein